jgi:iron complex outermembrane receptor protein
MRRLSSLITVFVLTAVLAVANLTVSAQVTPGKTAQTISGKIEGLVKDEKGQPIEAASVTLLSARDSSRVRQTVTDKTGHYEFDRVPTGKYLVSGSSVGFSLLYSASLEVKAGNTEVKTGNMVLQAASVSLKEIAVVAKRSPIEQKADRTIINVDASPSNAGSTAMDVLEKAPGVTLDKDDNISLKGKQSVTIMCAACLPPPSTRSS